MLTFGNSVALLIALVVPLRLAWVMASFGDSRKKYQPSAWFTGLLDAEAGEAVEPQDWDDEVFPGYWREYAQGAFDYRRHLEERLP